nr:uncharacterized protein LOC122172915 [Chrysemys picta bellii]
MLYPKEDYQGNGGQEVAASATCSKATKHRLVVESHVATRAELVGEPDMATKSNMAAMVRPVGDSNMAANAKLVGATNVAARSNTIGISGVTSSPAGTDMAARPLWHAGVFTVYITVLLATEIGFLWAVLARQLPMVSGVFFRGFPSTPACPPALECVVWGQPDKHMALVMLAFTACISILVCLGYGGMWLCQATCCRGRQERERALEVVHMREGCMCCDECEEGEMGEGRVLSGEWDAGMGVNQERKDWGEVDKGLEDETGGDQEWSLLGGEGRRLGSLSDPPLLSPKAIEAFSQMDGVETGDYDLFKQALLRQFELTPEAYKKQFQGVCKASGVTYKEVANLLEEYLRKWGKGTGATTAEDVYNLVGLEQLYDICPPDLKMWLVDRKHCGVVVITDKVAVLWDEISSQTKNS